MSAPVPADHLTPPPASPARGPRTPWPMGLALPFLAVIRPSEAARSVTRGGAGVATAGFLAFVTVGWLTWDALLAWSDTRLLSWTPVPASNTQSWTGLVVQQRSFLDAWRANHRGRILSFPDLPTLSLIAVAVALVTAVALTHLPTVHRGPRWQDGFSLILRGAPLLGGPFLVLLAGAGTAIVLLYFAEIESRAGLRYSGRYEPIAGATGVAALGVWLAWAGAVLRVLAAGAPRPPPAPPLCESCGYDLTHVAADGRCTECGAAVADSLDQPRSRPGNPWEAGRWAATPIGWLRATWTVLTDPGGFYRSTRLVAGPDAAESFARWHFRVMLVVTAYWAVAATPLLDARREPRGPVAAAVALSAALGALLLAAVCLTHPSRRVFRICGLAVLTHLGTSLAALYATDGGYAGRAEDRLLLCVFSALLAGIVAWALHRGVAFLACVGWYSRRWFSRPAVARVVVACEAAFLWVFWAYEIVLCTSLMAWDNWLTRALGRPPWRGIPYWEFFAVLVVPPLLCVAWLWRYRVAGRAARWANY